MIYPLPDIISYDDASKRLKINGKKLMMLYPHRWDVLPLVLNEVKIINKNGYTSLYHIVGREEPVVIISSQTEEYKLDPIDQFTCFDEPEKLMCGDCVVELCWISGDGYHIASSE
jgi:hypothetical protein